MDSRANRYIHAGDSTTQNTHSHLTNTVISHRHLSPSQQQIQSLFNPPRTPSSPSPLLSTNPPAAHSPGTHTLDTYHAPPHQTVRFFPQKMWVGFFLAWLCINPPWTPQSRYKTPNMTHPATAVFTEPSNRLRPTSIRPPFTLCLVKWSKLLVHTIRKSYLFSMLLPPASFKSNP